MISTFLSFEDLTAYQHPVPEQVNGNEQNNKRRKRQSDVWKEMTKHKREDTEEKDWEEMTKNVRKHKEGKDIEELAQCNLCLKMFDGSSKLGTTHLKNHLIRCKTKRKVGEDTQKSIRTNDIMSTDVIKETSVMDWIENCFDEKGYPTENWNPSALNSRKVDILQAYQEEKEKLRKFFSQLSCRISLRIEPFDGRYSLTAHYIDENWEWESKFISFLNGNYGCKSFIETLKELCSDLKIVGNIYSIVVGGNDDDVIGEINRWFTQQRSLPVGGFLGFCDTILEDIYVLLPDSVDRMDPDFKSINLTKERWDEATTVLELEKSINNIRSLFRTNSPTPNMHFSNFCDLYVNLLQAERSVGYPHGKYNSSRQTGILAVMKQKFIDKYWSQYNLVLVSTIILDPRFKMDIVLLWYSRIYGCDADHYIEDIIDKFENVYNKYAKGLQTSSISYLDAMGRPCSSSHNVISPESQLYRYLNEPKFPSVENFDILIWWRLYSPIFPTLARMARDFLAVPLFNCVMRNYS